MLWFVLAACADWPRHANLPADEDLVPGSEVGEQFDLDWQELDVTELDGLQLRREGDGRAWLVPLDAAPIAATLLAVDFGTLCVTLDTGSAVLSRDGVEDAGGTEWGLAVEGMTPYDLDVADASRLALSMVGLSRDNGASPCPTPPED